MLKCQECESEYASQCICTGIFCLDHMFNYHRFNCTLLGKKMIREEDLNDFPAAKKLLKVDEISSNEDKNKNEGEINSKNIIKYKI